MWRIAVLQCCFGADYHGGRLEFFLLLLFSGLLSLLLGSICITLLVSRDWRIYLCAFLLYGMHKAMLWIDLSVLFLFWGSLDLDCIGHGV